MVSQSTLRAPQSLPQESYAAAPMKLPQNVAEQERLGSLIGGAALIGLGLFGPRPIRLLSVLSGAALAYRGATGHCHLYQALGLNTAERPYGTAVPAQQGVHLEESISIQRPAAELYREWRKLENLPQIMRHLEEVTVLDDRTSHWKVKGPRDIPVEWDAEIFQDRENELIAWRSLPGGDVDTAGSVHFRDLGEGRGTAMEFSLKYNPPGGKVGAAVAWLMGSGVASLIRDDLRRFKARLEAGEAPTTEGQPRGE